MTEHHTKITTFYPRRGRVSGRHEDALTRLWPLYGVDIPGPALDLPALFGRVAPVVLEIGSGMGDATVSMASADPSRDYLAVEVFPPGLGNLLAVVEESGLANVRVAAGDALELARNMLAPGSLDAIHIFFPDPWPKLRHHKRRLIQRINVPLLVSRLRPGGMLHCATDWPHYAEQMFEVLSADPTLAGGIVERPAHRPITKFEQRALSAGRPITDLIFSRESYVGPMRRFADRETAGRELAKALDYLRGKPVVVLGLPRGGVPVAAEVAQALGAPLDVIVVRKLGLPGQPEVAMGAIGEDGARVLNPEIAALIERAELGRIERIERAELERRVSMWRGGRASVPLAGHIAVIVDDGVATGATAAAACQVARLRGATRVVLAFPVAPPDAIEWLGRQADEVVAVLAPQRFAAVSEWYADFTPTPDAAVTRLLGSLPPC